MVADIYEMGSPIDAFGVYSRYRDPDEELVTIGTEGFVNESQLLFAKNRYFVRLSPSGTVTMEKSVFLSCAQSIAKGIPDDSSPRKTLDALRIPEIIPKTEVYIAQGVLGYAFFKKGLIEDAHLICNTVRVFVILRFSPNLEQAFHEEYVAYLESHVQSSLETQRTNVTCTHKTCRLPVIPFIKPGAVRQAVSLGAANFPSDRLIPMIRRLSIPHTVM